MLSRAARAAVSARSAAFRDWKTPTTANPNPIIEINTPAMLARSPTLLEAT
jgi:hypothetical protein